MTETNKEPIYKVNHIINGNIATIYVFNGNVDNNNDIFTSGELEEINTKNIKIIHSKQQIHLDDTIGMIKIKILNELKNTISLDI